MNRVILLIAVLVAIPFDACATNYYVDKTASGGSDSNNGIACISGGGSGPFLTIGKRAVITYFAVAMALTRVDHKLPPFVTLRLNRGGSEHARGVSE